LRLKLRDLLVELAFFVLALDLLLLGLALLDGCLLLKVTDFLAELCLQVFQCLSLLFVFLFPELFLLRDTFDLSLGVLLNLLPDDLHLVVEHLLAFFVGALQVFNPVVEEFNLLVQKRNLPTGLKLALHRIVLQLTNCKLLLFTAIDELFALLFMQQQSRLVLSCTLVKHILRTFRLRRQLSDLLILR